MAAAPKPKFMMLGKSKFIHVVHTKTYDLKNSHCLMVRKVQVADKMPKGKGLSPEAAAALDPCDHCNTTAILNEIMPVGKAKEDRKQGSKDFIEKMRPEPKTKKRKAAANAKEDRKNADVLPAKARKSETGDKAPKSAPRKSSMTKTGPKSLGGDLDKANILKQFAEEHGWKVKVAEDKPGYKLVAKRGKETITCWFDGGKYDTSRLGYIEVEGSSWQGKLRAAHACRRQIANEGRDRPHPNPGAGRSAPRAKAEEESPEDESPEDALKRVPFSADDDDLTIIDAIKGQTIRWRNGVSGSVEEALLPDRADGAKRPRIAITTHPTKSRRIIHFFAVEGRDEKGRDVYGSERSVAIDKIIRVM